VAELCRTFNIAKSTYYYRQNKDQNENTNIEDQLYSGHPAYDKDGNLVPEEDVIQLVKDYCDESPHLGYRMVTDYLNYTENLKVNHKRIYRIMKVLDLLQDKIVPKPKEYQLRQKHELTGPEQLWEMDMVQMHIDNSG
jgi:putative transposase